MFPLLLCAGLSIAVAPGRTAEFNRMTAALVKQLGDPAFRKREAAARRLLELGGPARPALAAASKDPDVEIRSRARQLLPQAVEVDIRRQLARFLADPTGVERIDLPGWNTYRRAAGDDPAARRFFADTFRDNFDLLGELDSDPLVAWQGGVQRTMETQMAMQAQFLGLRRPGGPAAPQQAVDIHQMAALMLIGMDDGVRKARKRTAARAADGQAIAETRFPLAQLMGTDSFRNYLTVHAESPRFKKLFLAWLELQTANSNTSLELYYAMQAIKTGRLTDALDFVERTVKSKDVAAYTRGQALMCLMTIGGPTHLAMLEPLLRDKAQVSNFGVGGAGKMYESQIRDVALGVTIKLSGEKPSRFGFDGMSVFGGDDDATMQWYSLSFTSEANRKAAFDKWNAFAAAKRKKGDTIKL